MENLKYSCYVFVSNMLSDRAIGAQGAHAVAELSILGDENYENYVKNHKRIVFLNGGSTNKSKTYKGQLNQLYETIVGLGICKVGVFYEENVGDQMTAFALVVDERIYDHNAYPLFTEWLFQNGIQSVMHLGNGKIYKTIEEQYPLKYQEYLDLIGGEKNYEMKKILSASRTI